VSVSHENGLRANPEESKGSSDVVKPSRGVVLWPDGSTNQVIRALWDGIEAHGVPSMATHSHKLHQPHVSLTVATHIPVRAALEAVQPVPRAPIRLLVEAAGAFPAEPPSGREGTYVVLFLACVANTELISEQRRVYDAIRPLAVGSWSHLEPATWTPHITTVWALTPEQLATVLPIVISKLPIKGWLDRGGVEDGRTGERWTSPEGLDSDL